VCRSINLVFLGLSDSEEEIWLLLRTIRDPEYPFTLAQLRVVSPGFIRVFDKARIVSILFKPTVPHCSLSTLIGLAIRVRIMNDFLVDPAWKLIVQIVPGSHELRHEINKQLMDKERIAAAAENPHVMKIVNDCLALH
jgi:metal-sulfur cluster biosynthetic enzyme